VLSEEYADRNCLSEFMETWAHKYKFSFPENCAVHHLKVLTGEILRVYLILFF